MKRLITLIVCAFFSIQAHAAKTKEVEIPRTSLKDIYKYYVLEETKKATNFAISYKRLSATSMLYGIAEINCPSKAIRSLGQSVKSVKDIDTSKPSAWQTPTLGTIESDMITYVCR